jgi:hypothetical protein
MWLIFTISALQHVVLLYDFGMHMSKGIKDAQSGHGAHAICTPVYRPAGREPRYEHGYVAVMATVAVVGEPEYAVKAVMDSGLLGRPGSAWMVPTDAWGVLKAGAGPSPVSNTTLPAFTSQVVVHTHHASLMDGPPQSPTDKAGTAAATAAASTGTLSAPAADAPAAALVLEAFLWAVEASTEESKYDTPLAVNAPHAMNRLPSHTLPTMYTDVPAGMHVVTSHAHCAAKAGDSAYRYGRYAVAIS